MFKYTESKKHKIWDSVWVGTHAKIYDSIIARWKKPASEQVQILASSEKNELFFYGRSPVKFNITLKWEIDRND